MRRACEGYCGGYVDMSDVKIVEGGERFCPDCQIEYKRREYYNTEQKPDREIIWMAEIEKESGVIITVPCTSRGVAKSESERIASEMDDPVESWTGNWKEGVSEWGRMESGRHVIVNQRRIIDSTERSKP